MQDSFLRNGLVSHFKVEGGSACGLSQTTGAMILRSDPRGVNCRRCLRSLAWQAAVKRLDDCEGWLYVHSKVKRLFRCPWCANILERSSDVAYCSRMLCWFEIYRVEGGTCMIRPSRLTHGAHPGRITIPDGWLVVGPKEMM